MTWEFLNNVYGKPGNKMIFDLCSDLRIIATQKNHTKMNEKNLSEALKLLNSTSTSARPGALMADASISQLTRRS